ncbi:hypothetical protein [Streptomyces sp. NBC_01190]|uniref:hypothetical protein n=1 Tax=Streptomyces sp. NBC_01190 TaxID=2903767 RepID=UPI00386F068F|nr:hypothetical protein OG519_15155 [Streptomyces sp. NBC_01190]
MRLLDDLQQSLARRYRQVVSSRRQNFGSEVKYTAAWIGKQPPLAAIIAEARKVEEPPPQEDWLRQCQDEDGIVWPTQTEEGRAVLAWDLLSSLQPDQAENLAVQICARTTRNIDDMIRQFAHDAFTPLFDWLAEQLQNRSSVVAALRRYVYLTERFNRVALNAQYLERTSTGEELYNDDLQKFLFQDAHYVTYAKPRSTTGEPDLVGELEGEDPIVLDGKLFKGDVAYVARGVRQVYEYALDYGKHVAYLVVFNRTDNRTLVVDGDGPADSWPPYFDMAGVRVYIVVVRACPPATTASKMGRLKTAILRASDVEKAREED